MTVCFCPSCCDDALPTYTEAWRSECEARYVATWPLLKRKEYLVEVEKARGKDAAEKLRRALPA